VDATAATCDTCGHVFGETQAISKAEMEAAAARERRREPKRVSANDFNIKSTKVGAKTNAGPVLQRLPWGVIGVIAALAVVLGGGFWLVNRGVLGVNSVPAPTSQPGSTLSQAFTPTPAEVGNTVPVIIGNPEPTLTAPPTLTPVPVFPTRTPVPPQQYTIVNGDTCGGIATRFDVPLSELLRLNGLNESDCTRIRVGDPLLIPVPTPTPGPTETPDPASALPQPGGAAAAETAPAASAAGSTAATYTVAANDTCSQIAERNNITLDALIAANADQGLTQQCLIRPGQVLKLGSVVATPVIAFTPFALRTPTPRAGFAAPRMLSPVDGATFDAETDAVTLEWLSAGLLGPNEWYVIRVQAEGATRVPVFETKATSLRLSPALLEGNAEQAFVWWVEIAQKVGSMSDGVPIYNGVSAPAPARRFVWRRPVAAAETATP
jgi:LysM repeat protein